MIISILSKSSLEYSIFVSTFHATRLVISNWKIPSLSTFFDSLTKEKDRIIHMGALRSCKGNGHAIRFYISNWKIPSLSTFFDSLTKEKDKLIQMGALRISKGKDHSLIVQGSKNAKSKEKQIVKEKSQCQIMKMKVRSLLMKVQ